MVSTPLSFDHNLMYGPGGTNLTPAVLQAMNRPYVNPWCGDFVAYHEQTLALLKQLYRTDDDVLTMIGPIRAVMDAVMCSLVQPGEKVAIAANGYWSELFVEITRWHDGVPVVLDEEWGKPLDPDRVREQLDEASSDIRTLVATHVETSTGVVNPAAALGEIARERDLLYVLDCAQSLGGMPVDTDGWGVDFCLGGNHKCISSPAGLGYTTISQRGWETVEARQSPIRGWYSNLLVWRDVWMERNRVWFTFPASVLFGLRAALDTIFEEGLERVYARYAQAAKAIRQGFMAMGLELTVDCAPCPGCDSPARHCADSVTAVRYPAGVRHADFAEMMHDRYGVAVGGGLGAFKDLIFRVGPTGLVQLQPANVLRLLQSAGMTLHNLSVEVPIRAGLDVAEDIIEGRSEQ